MILQVEYAYDASLQKAEKCSGKLLSIKGSQNYSRNVYVYSHFRCGGNI